MLNYALMNGGRDWKRWRNHLAVIAAGVCLAGCATTAPPKRVLIDEPTHFARPLSPEAEKRAEAAAHFGAGLLYLSQNNRDDALKEFEQAIQLDPGNDELAVHLASDYDRQQQPEKAMAVIERSLVHSPDSLRLLFMAGHLYRTSNKPDKAQAAYERILKLDPTEVRAYENLVGMLLSQNKGRDALKLLHQAYKLKSDDAGFWAGLGNLFARVVAEGGPSAADPEKEGSKEGAPPKKQTPAQKPVNPLEGFARALDCYEKAAKLAPEDEDILLRLADLYFVNRLFDKAVPIYLKVLEQRPNRLDVRERIARSYIAQDELIKAVEQYEEMAKKEPLKFQYQMMLGSLYLDASRFATEDEPKQDKEGATGEKQRLLDKALAKFQEAVILNSNELEPQLNIAYIYLLQKKPQQTLETLDRAKEKFPTHSRIYYFYGLAYSDMKQYDQAVRAFADTAKLADDSTEHKLDSAFYFYYGAACERTGDIEAATDKFLKSIQINADDDEKNAEAYNYLGYMWAEKGVRLNEALDYIKKALVHEPKNGAYVDSLGWVYYKLGKYEDALRELLRAASLMKEPDPTVFDHIAQVYLHLGKKTEAIQHWKKAIEVDPNNKEIAEKLQQVQSPK